MVKAPLQWGSDLIPGIRSHKLHDAAKKKKEKVKKQNKKETK